jgi:predicted N-acyltransferase
MTKQTKWFNFECSTEPLSLPYSHQIYSRTDTLPASWDLLAMNNIFLSKNYLEALEKAAPSNMICHFIGVFRGTELVAIALSQFLDLNAIDCYGNKNQIKHLSLKNYLFRNYSSRILLMGNSMLSGQNAYAVSSTASIPQVLQALSLAADELRAIFKHKGIDMHLTSFKDFHTSEVGNFRMPAFKDNLRFSVQPNMVFTLSNEWKTEQDYVSAMSKKYRTQFKRSRTKAKGIEKRELGLEEIKEQEDKLQELYLHVASNAPFNSFFLPKNHFSVLKEKLLADFMLFGYFMDGQLIGFKTMISNGNVLDTYFLGYDDTIQKEKMLYLNMLYDMTSHAIHNGFSKIIFGRTALEIKSSIGAKPEEIIGLMKHSNKTINRFLPFFFNYLEPKTVWQERNPFQASSQ